MRFEIKTRELISLNEEVCILNKKFYYCYSHYPSFANPWAYKEVSEKIKELREKANEITPGSYFEVLVLKHIKSGLHAQQVYSDYFSKEDSPYSIEDVLEAVCGKGMFSVLEEMIRNIDYEKHWRVSLAQSDLALYSISQEDEEAYSKIKAMLPELKENIRRYSIACGFLPSEFDFELVLSPPYGRRSNWNHTLKRLELDARSFRCYKKGGKIFVNPSFAYIQAFHELAGHASQQIYSEEMPNCLKPMGFNIYNLVSYPITEGLAKDREDAGFNYVLEHKGDLGLTGKELEAFIDSHEL